MKYSLKYFVPISVLFVGLFIMGANVYFYATNEHQQRLTATKERIHNIGNRLVNEIEHKQLYSKESFAELTRIFSRYNFEYLNIAKMYNNKKEIIFTSIPAKFSNKNQDYNLEFISYAMQEKESKINVHEDEMRIDAVFPLVMPLKEGEIYSKEYGALYIEFDMSTQHKRLERNIYKYFIMNSFIVFFMVVFLSLFLHIFILRRLDILHKMTIELSKGNYNKRIQTSFQDEFSEVNHAFNDMAQIILEHNKELEIKIEEAVAKNIEQNKFIMQQNRFAAMGEMINNIAHQWRQPLNTVALILQKMELFQKRGMLDEKKFYESISRGMLQVEKMSTTIDDFRDFFKNDKKKQTFYLHELVNEVYLLVKNILEANAISFIVTVEKSTEIHTYKNELTQVLINLINNAKDALVDNKIQDAWIKISCSFENGDLSLMICDNAGGIDTKIIDKIFEPYFTTKEEGKGTGIGLYMSKTIIEENMNGKLIVENSQDGAVFKIIFSVDTLSPLCEVSCELESRMHRDEN